MEIKFCIYNYTEQRIKKHDKYKNQNDAAMASRIIATAIAPGSGQRLLFIFAGVSFMKAILNAPFLPASEMKFLTRSCKLKNLSQMSSIN